MEKRVLDVRKAKVLVKQHMAKHYPDVNVTDIQWFALNGSKILLTFERENLLTIEALKIGIFLQTKLDKNGYDVTEFKASKMNHKETVKRFYITFEGRLRNELI